jgi:CHAD domain-containing protein
MRESILDQLEVTAGAARAAALRPDDQLPTSVHEIRKALRRVRAIADLVAGALPKRERGRIRKALRDARKKLGVARDHAVVPSVLGTIDLDEAERDHLRVALEAATATAPSPTEIRTVVHETADCLRAQVNALRELLPLELDWSTLVGGARAVYGAARDARKAAKTSKRAYHAWRRRTKELTYQLEALAAIDPVRVADVHQEIEQTSDAQGRVVDVIMVRDLVRSDRHLRDALDSRLAPMMKETRRAARAVFRTKAGKFGKRLVRSNGAKAAE